jgi:hypothetical protein
MLKNGISRKPRAMIARYWFKDFNT